MRHILTVDVIPVDRRREGSVLVMLGMVYIVKDNIGMRPIGPEGLARS